jgi:hypothetical protein
MTRRCAAFMGVVGVVLAVAWLMPAFPAAQAPAAAPTAAAAAPAKPWTARTPDGQPDLQGFWTNSTYTPLQRPDNVTGEFFTREQAIDRMKQAAAEESEQTEPGTIADVHYDFTQFGLDRNQGGVPLNLRTSLIVDPANGKLPAMTAEGQKRAAARVQARKQQGALTDAAENQPLSVRCILMDRNGPPMIPGAYNNFYQIVQGPGYVMILVEMLHGTRIIPLDGTPQLPQNVRQWTGSPRGRWEGDTLVIETTNFNDARFSGFAANSPMSTLQGSSENLKLIERFRRVDADTLQYSFTVEDPATWTRPWTAEMPWKHSTGPIFEHACHEGNYGLYNTLAGARLEDKKKAAEAAAAKGTRQQ